MTSDIANAMTVDVEDYFQVQALAGQVSRRDWDSIPLRVAANTNRILDIFAANNAKATFFTLGWVAERCPELVRRIVAEGHELASHGYEHIRITEQTPDKFKEDVVRTKNLLEDLAGVDVTGYRAATFSITKRNLWAFDILGEAGYTYSSSVYPVRRDLYGIPDAPRRPFRPRGREGIVEIPMTTLHMLGRNWPSSGGGFFRLLPYAMSQLQIKTVNRTEQLPAIFYFHPWELDPDQPRVENLPWKSRFRHYVGLNKMQVRLESLLQTFQWEAMATVFADAMVTAPVQDVAGDS